MRHSVTDKMLQEKMEQIRLKRVAEGKIPDVKKQDELLKGLKTAKDSLDMLRILNEIDPYYHKMSYAINQNHQYLGVVVNIQFNKGEDYVRFPTEFGTAFDIPKVADNNPHRNSFTILKTEKKSKYDTKRSVSETTE